MTVNIYAITDSHQETRNLSKLLTNIYNIEKNNNKPFLLLDCGDLFKGVYDRELSVNTYLKFKELLPQAHIVITIGNNDFGFNNEDFEYFKQTVSKFKIAGIDYVCGNLKGNNPVDEYKIIDINNTRIFITGFCMQASVAKRFGLEFLPVNNCFKNLMFKANNCDNIIVLNHHWYQYSLELKNAFPDIDLIIGGHEHSPIEPDYRNSIFYPLAFAKSFYKMTLDHGIKNICQNFPVGFILPEFEQPLIKYERESKLYEPIAKRVLNLTKRYSEPCALGTFISDNMMRVAHTDIAFHSTGFTMYPLNVCDSDVITKYDFEKVICASTPVVRVYLTTLQLKKVFENATKNRPNKNNGNARFLQCSKNIDITGREKDGEYKIVQIKINGEKLLNKDADPICSEHLYSCAIDEFISRGEQGFDMLKNIPHEVVKENGEEIHLNALLLESLKMAEKFYPHKSEYPVFGLHDL